MTKEETYDTHVYVEGRDRPLPVGMYTDEDSEICSIRFSNSFTLNVVSPQDLIDFAQEIETFGRRAMELHYGDNSQRMTAMSESIAQLQKKLEDCGVVAPVNEAKINETRARYLREEDDVRPTKVTTIETPDGILTCHEPYDPEDTVARVMAEEAKSPEEAMMKGTVSGPVWKDPSDPVNW